MNFLHRASLWVSGSTFAATLMLPLAVFATPTPCVDGINFGTCTVPAGASSVLIEAWGPGGNGGFGSRSPALAAGGGGGGSYCGATFAVTAGGVLTIDSMSANASVTGNGISGMTANGGTAGSSNAGGQGGSTSGCSAPGGTKNSGGDGSLGNTGLYGGGGGGSGSNIGPGSPGDLKFGGQGQGNGGDGEDNLNPNPILATSGSAPGGGGGGGGSSDTRSGFGGQAMVKLTFTYAAPTVSGILPTSGPTAGSTSVVITGTNFTGASAVKFGSTNASSFTVNSATQITASSPAGSAGAVDITVITAGGTSATSASDQFTYVGAPTVSGILPTSGPTAGSTSVVITGTNFTGASAVKFGSTNASSFTVNSATQITASSPAGSAGAVDITVITAGGTSATSASDQFTYVGAPTVSGILPTSGPTAGGTSVTITGNNLSSATGVTIGGNACTSLSSNTATSVTCTTAAHAAGTASVLVTTIGGTNLANTLYTYTVRQTPPINTTNGGGTVVAQIVIGSAGCSIDLNNTTAFTPPSFNGTTPPYGGLKLKLTGCNPGETVQVSTTWPNMAGLTFQKYGPTPTSSGASIYYTPNGMSIAGNTVTYNITDNGLGDDTFTGADGVINDPAVPVSFAAIAAGIPTLSEWGMIMLASIMAMLGLVRLRRGQVL